MRGYSFALDNVMTQWLHHAAQSGGILTSILRCVVEFERFGRFATSFVRWVWTEMLIFLSNSSAIGRPGSKPVRLTAPFSAAPDHSAVLSMLCFVTEFERSPWFSSRSCKRYCNERCCFRRFHEVLLVRTRQCDDSVATPCSTIQWYSDITSPFRR